MDKLDRTVTWSRDFLSKFQVEGSRPDLISTNHIMRVSQVWKQVAAASKVVFDEKKHFGELGRTRIQLSGDQPLDVYIKASTDGKFGTRIANLL